MHVNDSSPYHTQESIKVCVVNSKGNIANIDCANNLLIEKMKMTALFHFLGDQVECLKACDYYKLVSVSKKKTLSDEASIRDEDINSGDILLLLERYPLQTNSSILNDISNGDTSQKKVTEAMINEATKNLKPKNANHKIIENVPSYEFHNELRKILISLVDYAEKLLRNHKDVSPILKEMKAIDIDEVKKKESDGIDPTALKQLTDMGFALERSKRALKLNNMSPLEAMDWLLAYESSSSASPSTSSANHQVNYENTDIYPKVPAIVESYRSYKRKHFKPNMKSFNNLKQLGFEDNEILDALWIHSNNEVPAGDWLLKERRPKTDDLLRGLKMDNPIYRAVISNPIVQLGLVKPKVFFAFLQLIEEPNSTTRWLADAETAPVISQIFRIYHSEKHAVDCSSPLGVGSENEPRFSFQGENGNSHILNSD